MNDLLNQIWNVSQPVLIMLCSAISVTILIWATNAYKKSEWRKNLPWVLRGGLDMAVDFAVRKYLPKADELKEVYGGILPDNEAADLHEAAVNEAVKLVQQTQPKKAAAIPPEKLKEMISKRIPDAVDKINEKRRKPNPNKPGGAGAHP